MTTVTAKFSPAPQSIGGRTVRDAHSPFARSSGNRRQECKFQEFESQDF